MCILCVIQKWSRRVAAMLPWLVIPLIGLWALSQLLPPAFRFEITSPRLACLFVLLVTLFWYEILMPQLSAWRVRRNALLQERKRFEAIEMEKLRKTATRRCRNCLTPYRDQNPGGGRFMCSYCGHISKRPVLDLHVPPGMGISNSGFIRDLIGKGGKLLNGKMSPENGWMCGQEWLENGNWVGGFVAGKSTHWRKNGSTLFGGDEHCLAEKSYSGVLIFAYKLLTSIFLGIRWVWRKIFRVSSPGDESSSSNVQKELLAKRFQNEINCHESRGEKARRKAEEKRQARLERELLEEEERKQREEVARLVEERRRLRDEKLEAEKDSSKSLKTLKEKDSKKEAEKKRQERRKDRDRIPSKSNSDAEEPDRKAGKDVERKRQQNDRREQQNDRREQQKLSSEDAKGDYTEADHGHGAKNFSANSVSRPSTSTKYFDRMKGTILSSSKAFTGGSFFGKGANVPVSATKETRTNSSLDHSQLSVHRRDLYTPDRTAGRSHMNRDEKSACHPVLSETQPTSAPKKSWHQLFTRSSSVPTSSETNISGTNTKPQADVQIQHLPSESCSVQTFDNLISIGLSSPFTLPTYPYQPSSSSSSVGFSPAMEPKIPRIQEGFHDALHEEPELFEDPCYVPDAASLLGPVSESLNNFLLDTGLEKPNSFKGKPSASSEPSKPSPIESPLSRSRITDETHIDPCYTSYADDMNANEKGTYQMWNSPPLVQEGLSLLDGLGLLNRPNMVDTVHPSPQNTTTSLFSNEDPLLPGTLSPRRDLLGNGQNGGVFSSITSSKNHDPWFQKALFPPLLGNNNQFRPSASEEGARDELIFAGPGCAPDQRPFELPSANCWPKNTAEGQEKQSAVERPTSVGSLSSKPDVHSSFW